MVVLLAKATVVIILQSIHVSNQHFVHLIHNAICQLYYKKKKKKQTINTPLLKDSVKMAFK